MLGRTDSRLRLVSLLGIFALIASLLGLRLAYWQVGQSDMLRDIAGAQVLQPGEGLAIERGEILDRSGNVLATTAYRDLLAAYPDLMSDEERESVPAQLAQILGMTAGNESFPLDFNTGGLNDAQHRRRNFGADAVSRNECYLMRHLTFITWRKFVKSSRSRNCLNAASAVRFRFFSIRNSRLTLSIPCDINRSVPAENEKTNLQRFD